MPCMARQLAVRLAEARDARGWTNEELAERAGIKRTEQVSRWANLRLGISYANAARLAEALDVSVDWLLGRDAPKPASRRVEPGDLVVPARVVQEGHEAVFRWILEAMAGDCVKRGTG